MERLQMCKGRSGDDFEDGDDERGFRNTLVPSRLL